MTEHEFLALPQSNTRTELLDGQVYMSPSPFFIHQRITGELYAAALVWAQSHAPAIAGIAPLDVRLANARILQPDVLVLNTGWDHARRIIDVPPDLVIEVLSGSPSRKDLDRVRKRTMYLESGVKEVWCADPDHKHIDVWTPTTYQRYTQQVTSAACPGLTIIIPLILRD